MLLASSYSRGGVVCYDDSIRFMDAVDPLCVIKLVVLKIFGELGECPTSLLQGPIQETNNGSNDSLNWRSSLCAAEG